MAQRDSISENHSDDARVAGEGREMLIEEVVSQVGASRRNIKYWTRVHSLPVRREGRRNFYPPLTVSILGAVARLAELQVHTTRYIRWLIAAALDRPITDPDFRRFATERAAIEAVLDSTRLARLPAAASPARRTAPGAVGALATPREDDIIL